MAGFAFGSDRFLDWCHRRYGGAVSLRTYFDDGFVMVFDPELIKQVFQGSPEQLHAGDANVMLGPLLGRRSVLLLDGTEHLRHRRLLLPPFHGERMRSWADVIHPDLPRPGRMWLMQQLANRFGGTPDQYARAFTALFLLAHGAADLLTTTTDGLARNEVRSHFLAAAGALLNNIAILRP